LDQENLVRRSAFVHSFSSIVIAAFAADFAAADSSNLETVVVTATRIPTPESQVASSVTVISADDIAAMQTQTLPDVLKNVPGLNIVQTGGPGGQTSVFMRGTNSNHVKVLVDGIDMSDPSSPTASFNFGQFLTQDIQKVEVLRGPQSGLYGSDAIGGVINVITKAGQGPAQFTATVEGGSFDTFNQFASLSGSLDRFHYSADFQHFHAGATPVTPPEALLTGPPGLQRIDDYYDNLTGSTKLGYDIADNFDLGLVARYTDTHLRFTSDNYDNYPDTFPDSEQSTSDTTQYYTRFTAHNLAFEGVLDHTLGVAYSNIKSTNFTPDDGGSNSEYAGDRLKVDYQANIRLAADQHLIVGAEHQRDAISEPFSAETTINSGYGELQSSFGESFFNTLAVRYDDNDRFGSKVTYRIAPVYLITDTDTKLKASIGTGFKAPTLSELFQNFPPYFFGNPNLKPETSLGYDFGFEQALFSRTVNFGATLYRNDIKNLIDDNADFTSYTNVGKARTEGVESFVSYEPFSAYTARLDYTFTEAWDEIANIQLLRRPKHKASLRNSWQATSQLAFDLTILYVGSWVDGNRDFTNLVPLNAPSYTTANVAGNYAISGNVSVYARINNLFDRKYEDPLGYLQPSIGAYAGVKVKF
jgi:vitamin B12 transporter